MSLLTLAEAKTAINATATTNDIEIQDMVDGILSSVEDFVGPVISRQVIGEVTSVTDAMTIPLRQTPVLSVESITSIYNTGGAGAAIWLTAALHVDKTAGIVRRLDRGGFYLGPWSVNYTVGRASVPPAINQAARIIFQHLWATQRGASKRPGLGGDDMAQITGFGYAIPNRAAELLAPFARAQGIA